MFDASDTVASFGERNFGHCFLGDPRRTRRLVRAADQILAHPDKALPHKFASPKDYRAVLRLVNHPAVTHAALLRVHAQRVLEQLRADGPAVVVLPEDTTELDFSGQNTLALGSIGNGGGQGFECHNTLAVDPHSRAIYGLVDQILHRRRKVPKGEGTDAKRRHPERESRLWVKAADNVGPARGPTLGACLRSRGGHLRVPRLPGSQPPLVCLPLLPEPGLRSRGGRRRATAVARPASGLALPSDLGGGGVGPESQELPAGAVGA